MLDLETGSRDENRIADLVYDNNWHAMLHDRPFLKFNGVYISTVNYQREGGRPEFSNAWNLPFRIITYYRYLRFYPDGTSLKMSTILEPQKIVYKFHKHWRKLFNMDNEWENQVYEGQWEITLDGKVKIDSCGPVENYRFVDEFQIVDGGKYAMHHKLDWIRMGYVRLIENRNGNGPNVNANGNGQRDGAGNANANGQRGGVNGPGNGEDDGHRDEEDNVERVVGDLNIDNERSFRFSRVKSYYESSFYEN
ncbi:unnamed protein product [Ambrosiozyma monospora]|uniref:Unnamed protein product n=1 Tax=Ambrosiozyma monospora TaxID=43982 RepID=A0A9W6Z3S0_AMBMO|nr:unnamed protein product [Ambrosiozyma monospora]